MSRIFRAGESLIREGKAQYVGGHSRLGTKVGGTLVLTNKRFFFEYQTGGLLSKRSATLYNAPVGTIMDAKVEKAGLLGGNVLRVTIETETGIENPTFKVDDPEGWVSAVQRSLGGAVESGT